MDPLSITASIIGIVTFAEQVHGAISAFLEAYYAADSELLSITTELDILRGVLESLQNAYQTSEGGTENTWAGFGNKFKGLIKGKHKHSTTEGTKTDEVLKGVLNGLEASMKKLDDIVKTSSDRMSRGGIHKLRVRALWQRTSVGIEKVIYRK